MPEFSGIIPAAIIILLLLFSIWFSRRRRLSDGYRFTDGGLLPPAEKTIRLRLFSYKKYILWAATLFLLIALSGPRLGIKKAYTNLSGIAISLLIDRSGSMRGRMIYNGRDVSRLDAVKTAIREYLRYKQTGAALNNDLIAVSSFSGFYEENSPFTSNYAGIGEFIQSIAHSQKYEDGTMIGDALYQSVLRFSIFDEAQNDLNYTGGDIKTRIIILLTDGQQTEGGMHQPVDAAEFAASKNIKVYTIGIGNPSPGLFGLSLSRFIPPDTDTLEMIAKKTNGQFVYIESGDELRQVYKKIDELEKSAVPKTITVYEEQYAPFLYIGALLLLIYIIIDFFIAEKLI